MENFPSNSQRPQQPHAPEPQPEPEKRVEKPVVGGVTRRKKPLGRRFIETFFSGEAPKSVLGYVAMEVLLPAAKDMVSDGVREITDRMLWGGIGGRSSSRRTTVRSGGSTPYVSYSRTSSSGRRDDPRDRPGLSARARAQHDFGEIIIGSRAEADSVLNAMYTLLDKYDHVRVADLYDLTEITSQSFTDHDWGWKDLRGSDVRKVRDGWVLVLPPTEPLK